MLRYAVVFLLFAASTALSAPAEDHWGAPPSADFGRATDLVKSAKYDEALPILVDLAEASPGDPDVFNLLGFSYRKTGDLERASSNYMRALRLSPDHLGALAYQGELLLMRGNIAAAEGNLARLASLCAAGCDERSELATAVADWKAAQN